jgi:integrase
MLTDTNIRQAKASDKPVLLFDELGLYLEISPKGIKSWRLRLRSKERGDKLLTLGRYPAMTLAQARKQRTVERGIAAEATAAVPPTFREVALEWWQTNRAGSRWKPSHADDVWAGIERELVPALGDKFITEIKAPAIKDILKAIEARGAPEVAQDTRQRVEAVFRYAEAGGMREGNPAAAMREIMAPLPAAKPRAAAITLDGVRTVLAAAESVPAYPIIRLGLRFLALTVQRPGEVRFAEWSEFGGWDTDQNPLWTIPAHRMKMNRTQIVPLVPQAVEVLKELRKLTGGCALAFPTIHNRSKPMSEASIGALLNRAVARGSHVPHGFRASFSTIMNERRKADGAVIELMLSHVKADKVAGAYDRAEHMNTRWEIAREWADLLLEGRPGAAELVKLPKQRAKKVAA